MRDILGVRAMTVRAGVRSILSPAGLSGAAVEIAGSPRTSRCTRQGSPRNGHRLSSRGTRCATAVAGAGLGDQGHRGGGTPILLVHGLVDNRSVFTLLRRRLRRRGFGRVVSMNYSPLTADVRVAATLLAEQVEQLCDETGYERIHVVGHSLGGIVARYYVQCLGGDARVHTLVTLGHRTRGRWPPTSSPTR